MPTVQQVLAYARKQADELQKDMKATEDHMTGTPFWVATDLQALGRIQGKVAAALETFRQFAGPESAWLKRAVAATNGVGAGSDISGFRTVGNLLNEWADQVEAGVTEIAGSRAWAEIGIVSTDLMGQVRRLLEDRSVTPAAPIVLCGAALEIALRAVTEARGVELPEKPTINTLVTALRAANLITAQNVKDITALAGTRNEAAHGLLDNLSMERAAVTEMQTNILLRTLAELIPIEESTQ